MRRINSKNRKLNRLLVSAVLLLTMLIQCFQAVFYTVNAEENGFDLTGSIYVFEDKKS